MLSEEHKSGHVFLMLLFTWWINVKTYTAGYWNRVSFLLLSYINKMMLNDSRTFFNLRLVKLLWLTSNRKNSINLNILKISKSSHRINRWIFCYVKFWVNFLHLRPVPLSTLVGDAVQQTCVHNRDFFYLNKNFSFTNK